MLANFSIVPLGKEASLSRYIAAVLKIVEDSGIHYKIHPMGTVIEGDIDDVFLVIKMCHQKMLKYSDRVLTNITIDDRKGATNRIAGKVASVERELGKSLNKV